MAYRLGIPAEQFLSSLKGRGTIFSVTSPSRLGLAGLFLALLSLGSRCGERDPHETALQVAARENPRPVEGQLSTASRYVVWSPRPKPPASPFSAFDIERGVLSFRGASRSPQILRAENAHREALLQLHRGRTEPAVRLLRVAAELNPKSATLSDLSAAYLALAEEGRPWLHGDAIATAQRAVELDPNNSHAVFNQALALEKLSLVHLAELAWERYLRVEKKGDWWEEGASRLRTLRRPAGRGGWETVRSLLLQAASRGDRDALRRLTAEFSGQVKETLEAVLLPEAAESLGTPTEQDRVARAKCVAEVIAEAGEYLYLATVQSLERPASTSTPQHLAGYRDLQKGLALIPNCFAARAFFVEAQRNLSSLGSPLAFTARFEDLRCRTQSSEPKIKVHLQQLASDLANHSFPTLSARTEAMLGFQAVRGGRYLEAVPHYERAVQILARAGDYRRFFYQLMLGEAYRFLGDRTKSWENRLSALRGAARTGDRRYLPVALSGLALELASQNRRTAALAVTDEMLAHDRHWKNTETYTQSLLLRIQIAGSEGDRERTLRDIKECALLIDYFSQGGLRDKLATELMVAKAEAELAVHPEGALRSALASVLRAEASRDHFLLPRALLARAQVEAALQRRRQSQSSFERALRIYESQRNRLSSEEWRIYFLSSALPAVDSMVALQLEILGDARTTFLRAEQVRAFRLLDQFEKETPATIERLEEQLSEIPESVALLAFSVQKKQTLVWRLGRGMLTKIVLPLPRKDLAKLIQRTESAVRSGASGPRIQAVASKAYEALLRKPLAGLPPETELVFLPDRELYLLPFAALFDARRGRFLVEDHQSSIASSLAVYLESVIKESSWSRPPKRVLAIGDPAFDPKVFPSLRRLPGAEIEARSVSALYPSPKLLLGKDATRDRVLAALTGAEVVDLAAHVFVDPLDPLRSLIATAAGEPALETLTRSAEGFPSLRLAFLAGCQTAPGFSDGDREGVSGLARAFLRAGVPLVVGTRWEVADTATTPLSLSFHSHLRAGTPAAQALRLAQIAALRQSKSSTWAAFQLLR